MAEYKVLKKDGRAKRAEFKTVHGVIPIHIICTSGRGIRLFMNWEDCISLWYGISRY